jgi:hypothetical protein
MAINHRPEGRQISSEAEPESGRYLGKTTKITTAWSKELERAKT